MTDDNPITVQDFERTGRYIVYWAEDEVEAALAIGAVVGRRRFTPAESKWKGDRVRVVAGVYEMDEMFSLRNYDHHEGEPLHCPECETDYTGTVVVEHDTGERMACCPVCGKTFEVSA